MSNAIKQITEQLDAAFAEQDVKLEQDAVRWGLERMAAVDAAKEKIRAEKFRIESQDYETLFAIAGGKTWYNVFSGNGRGYVTEFMIKNQQAIAAKRNAKIAKKLNDAGIDEVLDAKMFFANDGFNGVFVINGERTVQIDSILAGGYNIQRLHQRVLVKIK